MQILRFLPSLGKLMLLALLVGCFSPLASALGPKFDAFVGFSRTGNDTFYPNVGGLNGVEGAFNLKVRRFVGVEADVAQYGLGSSGVVPRTTTVLVGPRVTVGALGIRVFAHGLIGLERSSNSSGLSISGSSATYVAGGGFDVPFAPFFGWRVAADYLKAPSLASGSGVNSREYYRYSTGPVFRF